MWWEKTPANMRMALESVEGAIRLLTVAQDSLEQFRPQTGRLGQLQDELTSLQRDLLDAMAELNS